MVFSSAVYLDVIIAIVIQNSGVVASERASVRAAYLLAKASGPLEYSAASLRAAGLADSPATSILKLT